MTGFRGGAHRRRSGRAPPRARDVRHRRFGSLGQRSADVPGSPATPCARQITFDPSGLPQGVQSLIRLASAVPERGEARGPAAPLPLLARLGTGWLSLSKSGQETVAFIGEATLSLARMMTGRAQLRRSDLFLLIQQVAPGAADRGADQHPGRADPGVRRVDPAADVRCPNLCRQPCRDRHDPRDGGDDGGDYHGRPHQPLAAQLGTMQVNEEIDAPRRSASIRWTSSSCRGW